MDVTNFIRVRDNKNNQIILNLLQIKMFIISKDETQVTFVHKDNSELSLIGEGNARQVLDYLGFGGKELPFIQES